MDSEEDDKQKLQKMIKYREMTIDDLGKVFHLGEKVFKVQKAPNSYRTWDEYDVIEFFQNDLEFCIIAEFKNDIIGFVLGTTVSKNNSAWKYGHLVWLGVHPDFQRMGVAEKLFLKFKTLMLKDGVRMLIVDTDAENLAALHFFRKHGFGNPQQHIYLTMNIDNERNRLKKKENGKNH
ncbi:MAG: GNAT family N-acetyltransferase [Desulfobacterales bacterium]|nr:GNAT family N-acetyltransferase [Desulfobacterales bacterium]